MGITANTEPDPNGMEELEFEFHRLLSMAEAFTGAEKLRQRIAPMPIEEKINRLQRFIEEENAMRDLTPYTIEDMRKKIDHATAKDDFHEERFQREGKAD